MTSPPEAPRAPVPLSAQIAELEREARWRRDMAVRYAASGGAESQRDKDQDAALDAAIRTLKWLQANEAKIKAALKPAKP